MDLQRTSARDLDKFIEDHLLPDTRFRDRVNEAIHTICSFLKERCFLRGGGPPVRVLKVVKVSAPARLGWGMAERAPVSTVEEREQKSGGLWSW